MANLDQMDLPPTGFLAGSYLDSMLAAIRQEIGANSRSRTTLSLEIDGIRHMENSGGKFVYRLMLSNPVNFSAEQLLQFRARNTKETITATVIKCDDDGLVVATQQPLPTDAKLINVTFDPAFIYRALGEYISQATATPVARQFLTKQLASLPSVPNRYRADLNEDQSVAVDEMTAVPIHLLWGPPGTGKTTTLGAAIAEWMKQGKRVLLVSTSNAAVDVAMKAILTRVSHKERRHLLRLGNSLDRDVSDITLAGKLRRVDFRIAAEARSAQDKLNQLSEFLSHRTISNDRFQALFAEYAKLEAVVDKANQKAAELLPCLIPDIRVFGCTLAKMVLDGEVFNQEFDIVVIDEVSMVSVIYAIAATTLAKNHVVLAGDPKQLPPICQSGQQDAEKWFGKNIYDWFGVGNWEDGVDTTHFSVLRTQYRMTNQIGGLVGRLSYGNVLRHGRNESGSPIEFVDLPPEWHTTHYSVTEKSYYHLSSIPIIHELVEALSDYDELLLLSPFRPQRSLLSALAFDLHDRFPKVRVSSSTIHRAQGSESRAVIVDLTTHRPENFVAFFRDRHCANLFNVGISRARDQLLIVGNRQMLTALARQSSFWASVADELETTIGVLPAAELLDDPLDPRDLFSLIANGSGEETTALYSHSPVNGQPAPFMKLLSDVEATRKLLVVPKHYEQLADDNVIVRHSNDCPPLFAANGYVAIPYQDGWLPVKSSNVARVLWRIGFSHLAEEEINPLMAKRFFCPDCANGDLVLRSAGRDGWFLVCSNAQSYECTFRRRLSLDDAKLKVKLQGMTCPAKHPLTARQGPRGIFLGCENYPDCDYHESLRMIEGV